MRSSRLNNVVQRSVFTLIVVLAVALSPWSSRASGLATTATAAEMPLGATLAVLAAPVEVKFAYTSVFVVGTDGLLLSEGDVVRTGPGGLAMLTFFDGSETQLGAEAQVQIEQVEATVAPQIAVLQTAGVTLNHVVPMPAGGTFRTDTPAATGLVRGTSYVVVVGVGPTDVSADWAVGQASATCGTSGDRSCATSVVLLTDRDGHVGRVDVAAHGTSTAAPLQLTKAGDAAASDAGRRVGARVAGATLQALEEAANARNAPEAARSAEHHARGVAAALVPLTRPAAAPVVQLTTPLLGNDADRTEPADADDRPLHQVATSARPAAAQPTVSSATPKPAAPLTHAPAEPSVVANVPTPARSMPPAPLADSDRAKTTTPPAPTVPTRS